MDSAFAIQAIGFVAVVLSLTVFQLNKRGHMLALSVVASLLYSVHFFLLGAPTGAAMNFINAIRYYAFGKVSPSKQNAWVLYVFLIIIATATWLTWQGWFSVLAALGSALSTLAFWQNNPTYIRRISMGVPPLWFSYNAIAGSYAGMVVEVFLFISNLIGQYRFDMIKPKTRLSARKKRAIATP